VRRNYQPNLLQIGILGHVIGYNQVPHVYGIEGAKVESDFHGFQ
jgi:hypothetical protein